MKLSTRGRYGMRAMMDLAMSYGNGAILLKDVAKRQNVSLKYLEQLVTPLRAAGLLRGVRGARGGYSLAKAPEEISLSEIVRALEGSPRAGGMRRQTRNRVAICSGCGCATHELWRDIYDAINNILDNKTLRDLADRQRDMIRDRTEAIISTTFECRIRPERPLGDFGMKEKTDEYRPIT